MARLTDTRARFLLFCMGLATVLMTFGSMTAPLFPLHTGVDQNCFLTMAKAMADGKVLYRDLFEQKGPLLYALHLPAAWFPQGRFFGVYLVQIAAWTWMLWEVGRLARMTAPAGTVRTARDCRWITALSGFVIVTACCYSRGDNAEEFCLPLLLTSLIDLLTWTMTPRQTDRPQFLRIVRSGVFAGCVLWVKFSMLGFYIGWCLLLGCFLWKRRRFGSAVMAGIAFLLGMALATVPWVIIFGQQHAIGDWLSVYLVANSTLYPRSITLWRRLFDFVVMDCLCNPLLMAAVLGGIYAFTRAFRADGNRWCAAVLPVTAACLYGFVFLGGVRYRYYLLIVGIYVPFGVIKALPWLKAKALHWLRPQVRSVRHALAAAVYGCVFLLASNCFYFIGKPQDYYPQVQFAAIMAETPQATLLNYHFLDGGFYLMSGSPLPDTRFFCRLNIPPERLPEMDASQEQLIAEAATDYVVIRWKKSETMEERHPFAGLAAQYDCIATAEEAYDRYCYALWRRKSSC